MQSPDYVGAIAEAAGFGPDEAKITQPASNQNSLQMRERFRHPLHGFLSNT